MLEEDPSKPQQKRPAEAQVQHRRKVSENQGVKDAGSNHSQQAASHFENVLPDVGCIEVVWKRYCHRLF